MATYLDIKDTHYAINQNKSSQNFSTSLDQQDRENERRLLLAVREISLLLANGATQSDIDGRLVSESANALKSNGLWKMRLCRELGGFELPIVSQIRILSALAAADTSSAWCTMVANNAISFIGNTMPDAAIERIFASGVPNCSIVAPPSGVATSVDGGYILNGTWRLATSIHHAEWIYGTSYVDRDPSRLLPFVAPVSDVELLHTWNVVGLKGIGSVDFTLKDYFLPSQLCGSEANPYEQIRGDRRYDVLNLEYSTSYEHLAFAFGAGRRALQEFQNLLTDSPVGRCSVDREVVQAEFGRLVVKMRALEALSFSFFSRVDAAALSHTEKWPDEDRHFPRALAVWATQLSLECGQFAFNRSGFASIRRPNILEKLLRDMNVAATHIAVEDSAFSSYALDLVETGSLFESISS